VTGDFKVSDPTCRAVKRKGTGMQEEREMSRRRFLKALRLGVDGLSMSGLFIRFPVLFFHFNGSYSTIGGNFAYFNQIFWKRGGVFSLKLLE
jgi:hypothetical protein